MPFSRPMLLAFTLAALAPGAALAAPTPVPGGANAISAMAAKSGATVFNGVLRIKVVALRDATAAEAATHGYIGTDKRVMYFQTLLHNGTHDTFTDGLSYTLADADDVSVDIPSRMIENINLHILQGAAERQFGSFVVDKDFKPTKLIVMCITCGSRGFRPVRFTLAP